MAIRAAHCHVCFVRLSGCRLAVTLTPRRIGHMRGHCPAFGALDAPIPFSLANLQLFGRHLNSPCAPAGRKPSACFSLVESEQFSVMDFASSLRVRVLRSGWSPPRPCRTGSIEATSFQRSLNGLI